MGLLREKIEDRQIDAITLAPELAADVDDVHTNAFLWHAQTFRQLAAHAEWVFHRSPHLNAAVSFHGNRRRVRFEIALMARRNAEGMFKHQIGVVESLLCIALLP